MEMALSVLVHPDRQVTLRARKHLQSWTKYVAVGIELQCP